jgi:transcriptional regulator with XRE-family HTH domain
MESQNAALLRHSLGRELAARRQAAGYTQSELAKLTGYARSTVSTVESGRQHVTREFWEYCDQALRTGGALVGAFRQMERAKAAEEAQRSTAMPTSAMDNEPSTLADYNKIGWPAQERDGRLELITGDELEALELDRPAAMLAVNWWLGTGGLPDEIRRLPALPAPSESLAVIAADEHFFFLVQGGMCPWVGGADMAGYTCDHNRSVNEPVIRWHAGGCRLPAPGSAASCGASATWLHMPAGPIRLPNPVTLLDLLAKALGAVRYRPDALALPGGILAVPAWQADR